MKDIFSHRRLKNGINLFVHSTKKFKTNTFCIFIHQNLKRETATMTALLPFVLKRGTKSFPTSRHLSLHLENLYGADMGGDILKRGERQILQFFLETINPKYINGKDIMDDSLTVFKELVLNPVLEDGGFKGEYVAQEKDVLRRIITSLYNDKFNYAIERCFQEMCKDEAFSIYKYGNIEDLEKINKNNLYLYYLECIYKCPMDFFVLGDVDEDEIAYKIERMFDFERREEKILNSGFFKKEITREKIVEENQDVNQGKLSMGFRTNTHYGDDDYYALMVYNGILGGGPHSKLFQNVREKAGLAYYAFSKLEKNKGLMLISCGIEFSNFDKALGIIKQQIEDIKEGKISNYEFDSSVKSIISSLKETADSPSMIISLYLDGIINGVRESTEDMIKKIQSVSKDDVRKVANKVELDTIFFLNKR